jgi:hypothetical protein
MYTLIKANLFNDIYKLRSNYYGVIFAKNYSTNGLPTNYWKLTKGKMQAYGDNVRRVSSASNFQQ